MSARLRLGPGKYVNALCLVGRPPSRGRAVTYCGRLVSQLVSRDEAYDVDATSYLGMYSYACKVSFVPVCVCRAGRISMPLSSNVLASWGRYVSWTEPAHEHPQWAVQINQEPQPKSLKGESSMYMANSRLSILISLGCGVTMGRVMCPISEHTARARVARSTLLHSGTP